MIAFLYGMVTALRLPARADSDPPEEVPRPLQRRGHKTARALSGRLVVSTLLGSSTLRALFGFLTLYLAFAIKERKVPVTVWHWRLSEQLATVTLVGALGVGTLLATAVGTRFRIHRPTLLQGLAIGITAVSAIFAAASGSLPGVAILCLVASVASGLSKLANDAVIQERIGEQVKASAFAHSETLLMTAWVVGGAVGLIPFTGRWGLIVAAAFMALGAARATYAAFELRKERLTGEVSNAEDTTVVAAAPDATTQPRPTGDAAASWPSAPDSPRPAAASGTTGPPSSVDGQPRPGGMGGQPAPPSGATGQSGRPGGMSGQPGPQRVPSSGGHGDATTARMPAGDPQRTMAGGKPVRQRRFSWRRRRTVETSHGAGGHAGQAGHGAAQTAHAGAQWRPDATKPMPVDVSAPISPAPDDRPMAPPGYTLYRPSSIDPTRRLAEDDDGQDGDGGR